MNEGFNGVNMAQSGMKYCKYCGNQIAEKAVICPMCGCQIEEIAQQPQPAYQQPIIINNNNNVSNNNNNNNNNINNNNNFGVVVGLGRPKNKWVAFFLCLCFGLLGAHKFYEGKKIMGIVYLFTLGIGGIGMIIDLILILTKPNPYYV